MDVLRQGMEKPREEILISTWIKDASVCIVKCKTKRSHHNHTAGWAYCMQLKISKYLHPLQTPLRISNDTYDVGMGDSCLAIFELSPFLFFSFF